MLSELRLENFKAFRSRPIPLSALTLLAGANGAGKSTVLQSLGLLRQSYDAGVLANDGIMLNGELVELGTGADVLHDGASENAVAITVAEDGREFRCAVGYRAEADLLRYDEAAFSEPHYRLVEGQYEGRPAYYIEPTPPATLNLPSFRVIKARAQEDLSVANEHHTSKLRARAATARSQPLDAPTLFGPGFQMLRADRISPAVVFSKSHQAVVRRRFLGVRGEYTAHFLSHNRDQPVSNQLVLRKTGDFGGLLLGQTTSWMQEFSPTVRLEVVDIPGTDFVRLGFRFGSGSFASSNTFRPTNVGFGLTYALPIVVALLASTPGSVVLLENPEAHLHPQGQMAMGRLCALVAFGGVQVIVETHSDHVLNGIRLAVKENPERAHDVALHFFQRKDGSSEPALLSPELRADGRLSVWPDGFFDQWDKALDQILD